jgi:thiol-disulfide isomerase/thioredoxin
MRVEKGRVRAPEIGRVWLNSPPLSLRQLRGRVVLVDFWDYTCVNCIRTLPYVQAWHER